MPLLDATGVTRDPFMRLMVSELDGHTHALIPWVVLDEALSRAAPAQELGAEVPNTVTVAALWPYLDRLSLIAIQFPTFSDGRGFSLARQVRNAGFAGRLRAVGPLIADQFAYALACGFDEVEPPAEILARQPVEHWLAARAAISHTYQRGFGRPVSIVDRRRAGSSSNGGSRP